jgi:hypothetical protein
MRFPALQCGGKKHETGILFEPQAIDLTTPTEAGPFYGGEKKFDYNGFWNDLNNDPLLVGLENANTSGMHYSGKAYASWGGYNKDVDPSTSAAGNHNFAVCVSHPTHVWSRPAAH